MPWPRRRKHSQAGPEPTAPADQQPAADQPAGSVDVESGPLPTVRTLTQRDHDQQQKQDQRRGPGRPRTSAPRSRQAAVGLSESEHAAWTRAAEQAGYRQLGRWIRAVVAEQLDQQQSESPPGLQQPDGAGGELGEVRDQLRRIGTNVNQLTRAVHAGVLAGDPVPAGEVAHQLHSVWQEMSRLRQAALNRAGAPTGQPAKPAPLSARSPPRSRGPQPQRSGTQRRSGVPSRRSGGRS